MEEIQNSGSQPGVISPPRDNWQHLETCFNVTIGGGSGAAISVEWGVARIIATHRIIHGMASTTKNYSAPNVSSTNAEVKRNVVHLR